MQQSRHFRQRLLSGPLGGVFPPAVVPPPVVVPPPPLLPSPVPRGGSPPIGPMGGVLEPPGLLTTTPPPLSPPVPVWIGVQRPPTLVANGPQLGWVTTIGPQPPPATRIMPAPHGGGSCTHLPSERWPLRHVTTPTGRHWKPPPAVRTAVVPRAQVGVAIGRQKLPNGVMFGPQVLVIGVGHAP